MDVLSDVFRTLRVRSTLYFRTALHAPWGLEVPVEPRVARFHLVIDGACLIDADPGGRVLLQRGDLALVPNGARHALLSDAGATIVPLERALDETAFDGTTDLCYGGEGPRTTLVCGHFAFADELSHPALATLPPLLHVSAADGHDLRWLDAATRMIGGETADRPPGWEVIVDRVAEIVFVHALRVRLANGEVPTPIAALADEHIARALSEIHAAPERPWSLEDLARSAGLSRTGFAVRFRELMGLPPMAYLTRWRLQRARRELVESSDPITDVAERACYASEAAFSRAFRRLYGTPPATYRRQHEA